MSDDLDWAILSRRGPSPDGRSTADAATGTPPQLRAAAAHRLPDSPAPGGRPCRVGVAHVVASSPRRPV